jgi:hypothetical protein
MYQWRILILVSGLLALAGCGGMSASECELADWRAVGYEDGVRGSSTDAFGRHRKSCAKHEVAPDFNNYQVGREAGLREYCQPERGYQEGSRGAKYLGVCPADLEASFYDNYLEGQILYNLESAVAKTSRQIDSNKSRMKTIENKLAGNTSEVLSDLSGEELAAILVETKQLAEERIELGQENEQLEARLEREKDELAAHKNQLVSRR